MQDDEKLNALLSARMAPEPSEGFADRVITTALAQTQLVAVGWAMPSRGNWRADLMQIFALPKPGFACAMALVAGLMIGLDLNVLMPDDNGIGDWSNLFTSGEGWL